MKRRLEAKKVGDAIHPPPKGRGLLALILKKRIFYEKGKTKILCAL